MQSLQSDNKRFPGALELESRLAYSFLTLKGNMKHCRLILPKWLKAERPDLKTKEGFFTDKQIKDYNAQGYNVYFLPNHPREYPTSGPVDGTHIDVFNCVFVDCDIKDRVYSNKDAFLEALGAAEIYPSKIIDSGNGIHVYWNISNLDAMSYLRFQRRLMRLFKTDESVATLYQLMRLPNTMNTKVKGAYVKCETLLVSDWVTYTAEEFDKLLPPITTEDEAYCIQHYEKTFNINQDNTPISDELPSKFGKLLRDNIEAKDLWAGNTDDRSKGDFRLGHIMFASGFTKDEALSVLINSAKALQRAPVHRRNYAVNIVDKIWTFELADNKDGLNLSSSVKDILQRAGSALKGTPFRCHPRIDNTEGGFRLGQVIGLVAGSGVGKTAFSLNMFQWFVQTNPDYHHFFVPLEQTDKEIADRWQTMCQGDTRLHDKVHILSNYDENGNFRHLSFDEIREYIEKFQATTKFKVGCVVVDHIGALKKKNSNDENQDLMAICHQMKAFAVQTNTLLVMQSQTSREKAGIGDLELNKDAAYGTSTFEWYCDFLITLWQPLKRCHSEQSCPTVTAFKFCKIRHKKKQDAIKEDVPYYLSFDSDTEQMYDMTQDQIVSFNFFLPKATNKRKADRKTELVAYTSVPQGINETAGTNSN